MPGHISAECLRVPGLHIDGPGTGELADQAFTGADSANDPSRRHALHDVFAVPRDKMAVVDDVAFPLDELNCAVSRSSFCC